MRFPKVIAAARVERAEYMASHLRSLVNRPWKISSSLNDFVRASQLIAVARANRSAFFSRLLRSWLHLDHSKRGHADGPEFS